MSIVGLMGFLMLVGIAVNNGIYLVDGTNQLRQTMPLGDALVEAGTTRLRPILMTTLTTILSMVPMAIGFGSGSEMMQGMALVIIGGPVSYTHLRHSHPPFSIHPIRYSYKFKGGFLSKMLFSIHK